MKTFKEYLAESKKFYTFKVKVAGPIPENFEEGLKQRLGRCGVKELTKEATTPIQALPLDFPTLKNMEVTIFNLVCEYPVIAPEVKNEIIIMGHGLSEACVSVKTAGDPSEAEQALWVDQAKLSETNLLQDENYKESAKVKVKEYWGADYNRGFLKDLEKASKARKKEQGQKDNTMSAKGADVDFGESSKSPVGSNQNTIPNPYKG